MYFIRKETLFSVYVNDVQKLSGTRLPMFADHTAVYAADRRGESTFVWLEQQLDSYVERAEK